MTPPRAARRRSLRRGGFGRFVLRRLVALVFLSLGITFVAFVLTELVPSNAVATNLGEQAAGDPAAVAAFKHHYGLDKPFPVRYAIYLDHLVHGDLGQSSLTHGPVTHDLGQFIPATGELALYSILFAAIVGIGVRRASRRSAATGRPTTLFASPRSPGSRCRRSGSRSSRSTSASSGSAGSPAPNGSIPARAPPPSVTGLYTIDALLAGNWGLFVQALHHLVLPALVLAAFNVSLLTRFTRSAVLEVIGNDYVRAARAKGMPERTVVLRYIVRGALPSVVTVLGLVFANVLTGAVLVEKIFSWPGIGQYAFQAAVNVDVPGDRRRQPVRRGRLHHRQLHRRRALRAHRPEDPGHMTRARGRAAASFAPRWLQGEPAPAARGRRRDDRARVDRDRGLRAADRTVRLARAERSRLAQSPSLHHLFGTDELGRDVLSRVIYGSRVSIPIALLLVALASVDRLRRRSDRRLLPRARRRRRSCAPSISSSRSRRSSSRWSSPPCSVAVCRTRRSRSSSSPGRRTRASCAGSCSRSATRSSCSRPG